MIQNPNFSTTNWSVVLAAAQSDPVHSVMALERLCQRYWFPAYAFVRQRGHDAHLAEDLTQEFFRFLLETEGLQRIRREKGRFRTFLLTALTNFLHNERDKAQAQKRGGGRRIISMDDESAESTLALEASNGETSERAFERHWAGMLVRRVLEELGREFEHRDKKAVFAGLQPFLTGEPTAADYERLASELGIEPGTIKVKLHRARRRFGELLRNEIAHTVESPEEVEAEIRHLLTVIAE